MRWKSSFRQNYRTTFSPTVPTSAAGFSHVVADVEAPGGEKWEHLKKSEGKQWQATPKKLPRMQRTRAIPVAWLNSGPCLDRPKGWIPIILVPLVRLIRGKHLILTTAVLRGTYFAYPEYKVIWVLSSQSSNTENRSLLGCDAVTLGEYLPMRQHLSFRYVTPSVTR